MNRIRFLETFLVMIIFILSGCRSANVDCTQPDVFCVGLVTEVGRREDSAYNLVAWQALQQTTDAGLTDWVASIETVDARDYELNLDVFARAGYDVIVSIGDAMADATRLAAISYPDLYFIGVDQDQPGDQEIRNLAGLVFAEDQIGFLAGALAAMLTSTGQIGAVCASDELPFMLRYGEGFLSGAAFIDPEVKVTVVYHNEVGLETTFLDPEWGAAQALSLVDSGSDIIFGVGGETGNNALVAAGTRRAYAIGADTDQSIGMPAAASYLYTSIVKLIAPGITELINLAKDAQAEGTGYPGGNYLGQIDLAPAHALGPSIPEEVRLRIDEINLALQSGEVETGAFETSP